MVKRLNLENQVQITQGSLLDTDLQPADVVIFIWIRARTTC